MKHVVYKPSFNHKVIKTLTKEQFLQDHPEHGDLWDEINKVETPKEDKPEKAAKKAKE